MTNTHERPVDGPDGRLRWMFPILAAACIAFTAGSGCQSANSAKPGSLAAVDIRGNTPGQVRPVAIEVFGTNGYTLASGGKKELVFEKPGGAWDNVAYGGWPGDTPVWIRLKISVTTLPGEPGVRLQCRAFRVLDRGSPTEQEVSISSSRKGPYQKLLEEVARRFRS